jgi:cell shape-determining protein MreC
VPSYVPEPESTGARRQAALAVVAILLSLVALYLPVAGQQAVAWSIRFSVLRPFIVLQDRLRSSALRAQAVEAVQAQMDSLTALTATQGALADENRTLRSLLELGDRMGPGFRPASVLRPGTAGSESMFILDLGAQDGVRVGAPVVDRHGLVGVIREVRPATSVGMDWTHPDFRASAMLADGSGYGVVETRRGDFREADRLILNGTAYYEAVPEGMAVLTSGLGGVFPRGIPIGAVDGVADAEGRWRKSYYLRPMVHPAAVTHVLVALGDGLKDVTPVWPPDSALTRTEAILRDRMIRNRLEVLEDSVLLLRARVQELQSRPLGPGVIR